MSYVFMTLKALLIDYNQFRKSKLQMCIMKVLNCSYTKAFELGKTHCNLLSTWALLYALQIYVESYEAFFRECLAKGLCDEHGDMKVDKIDTPDGPGLFTRLGIKCNITKYGSIPDDLEAGQLFQIALNGKHHFIAGASAEDKNIMAFDTNDRPYGAELIEALLTKGDKITWIKKYEKVTE